MATTRDAIANLAQFHKFTTVGQAVAGYVDKGGSNDNGEFIVLKPAMTRDGRDDAWTMSADAIAIGLSTDMLMKIDRQKDVGRYVLLEFNDTEPSKRGQPKKLFRVVELTKAEIIGLRDGSFTLPEAVAKKRETAEVPNDF